MATKSVMIISFEEDDPGKVALTMDEIRRVIPKDIPGVMIYAAIKDKPDKVIEHVKDLL